MTPAFLMVLGDPEAPIPVHFGGGETVSFPPGQPAFLIERKGGWVSLWVEGKKALVPRNWICEISF